MDMKQKHQKRRLDRRNAIKDIDYDASPSPSSSSFEDQSRHRTRSLDLPPVSAYRTSFRIQGIEGDVDRICHSLGLSGPDDFDIPAADWEARKARSSFDNLRSSRFRNSYNSEKIGVESTEDGLSDDFEDKLRVSDKLKHENECSELNGFNPAKIEIRVRKIDEVGHDDNESYQLNIVRKGVSVRRSNDGGCGINGARPPVLAPPPAMPPSVMDNVSSTWDIFKSFGPQDDKDLYSPVDLGLVRSPEGEDSAIEEDEEVDGQIFGKQDMDDRGVISESCSDTSNDDKEDDSSNMTVEPLYSISPSGKFKCSIKSWQKGDFLGSGSFGTVYEGFTDDGFFFAVKEVSLLDQGSQGQQSIYQLEQEISLLSQFEHENIVQYLGTDKADNKLYIFLELVTKGSLANLYQKYHLRDSQVSGYTRQILNGLNYLHCRNVVHRNIKCANILVDGSGFVKLADFGLTKATKLNDLCFWKGSSYWMAPEVVNRKNHGYGFAADIWSLGCTVLEMSSRKIPYSQLERMQALFMTGKGKPPPIPHSLSSEAKDFILKCFQVRPEDRPTAAELLEHPFVKRPSSGQPRFAPKCGEVFPRKHKKITPSIFKGLRSVSYLVSGKVRKGSTNSATQGKFEILYETENKVEGGQNLSATSNTKSLGEEELECFADDWSLQTPQSDPALGISNPLGKDDSTTGAGPQGGLSMELEWWNNMRKIVAMGLGMRFLFLKLLSRMEFFTKMIGKVPQSSKKEASDAILLLLENASLFSHHMSILRILDLSYTSIDSLPQSISRLIALQKFVLRGCELLMELPPEIGELKNLEVLDLEGTEIISLPMEIAKLINLMCLKVSFYGYVNQYHESKHRNTMIPRGALSNLSRLNELSIDVNPYVDWWDVEAKVIINDLCSLRELQILNLYLPTVELLEDLEWDNTSLICAALAHFRFIVGRQEEHFISRLPREVEEEFNNLEKGLKYINGEGIPSRITEALKHANAFWLERHWTIKNLFDFGLKNMEKLKFCLLMECNELQTIIDAKHFSQEGDCEEDDSDKITYYSDFDEEIGLGLLQYLSIHYMKNMESICQGPIGKGCLSNLKCLALHTCVSLTTIFIVAMLGNLVNLEKLIVEDCPKINSLVSLEYPSLKSGHFLPRLKNILLLELPELVNISNGLHIAPKLERMVIFYCPKLVKLSTLEVSSKDLKVIKGEKEWWGALKWHESDLSSDHEDYLASVFVPLRRDVDLMAQFTKD